MRRTTNLLCIIPILAYCLLTSFWAEAQTGRTWSIGPEGGVNFSTQKWNPEPFNHQFKSGVIAGIFATYSTRPTYSFTAKVLFSQRGDVIDSEDSNGNPLPHKTTLNYLEVPMLGRYFLIKKGKFRPNVFAGLSFAFLMGGATKEGSSNSVKIPNYSSVYHTFELGVTGGLGLSYEIANDIRILLDTRYTYGRTDISKGSPLIYSRTISVSTGVSFGI